ncbi:MAG: hypothetical protein ACR2PC_12890 [Tsuneonella suprasediminis]
MPDSEIAEADRQKALSEARKAAADARKAEIEAEAALEQARYSFLPQSPAEGKTTLGEGAGQSEASMLTTIAIQAAALEIRKKATGSQTAKIAANTLVIGGSDTLDISAYIAFRAEAIGVETQLKDALGVADLPACPTGTVGPELIGPGIGALVSGLAGMLRTDTEIRGVKTDLNDDLLVRAVAAQNPNLVIPKYRVAPTVEADNPVVCTMEQFNAARRQAQARLAAKPAPAAAVKARLEAAVKRSEDFYQSWTKPAENGNVRLAAAIAQAELVAPGVQVLRVHLDSQGGSLLTRRNLWTALGARAVAVSGGVVASFTLDDPFTGKVTKSGVFVCGTTLVSFRRVQKLEDLGGKCIPTTVEGNN